MGAVLSRTEANDSLLGRHTSLPAPALADRDQLIASHSSIISITPSQPSNVSDTSMTEHRNDDCFPFLELPPEIRTMIYKDLLFVGKVHFDPERHAANGRKHYHWPFKKPQLAVLRVCKQIHDEAEPLYLSMNLFVLPVKFTNYQPFFRPSLRDQTQRQRSHLFSKAAFDRVRNISVVFSSDQLGDIDYHHFWNAYETRYGPGTYMSMTDAQRRSLAHTLQHIIAEREWSHVQKQLSKFQNPMDYVEADFTDVFCPGGCCRPLYACINRWILKLKPKVLDVTGLMHSEQRNFYFMYARGDVARLYKPDVLQRVYGLHFMQSEEATKWDAFQGQAEK
ncbi:hypothetical protein BDW02DRAFT_632934 [Decorospora gaudefroyi]|uniref:Uncharacterized protein n=1 Tax=Decorospora gaudefroyi TaxID=184978 RepID=A0A6A5K113_9PLEO|nr:hypothetical protein BDW02DRAFT_632934 [Decorospora gaudefroyi]